MEIADKAGVPFELIISERTNLSRSLNKAMAEPNRRLTRVNSVTGNIIELGSDLNVCFSIMNFIPIWMIFELGVGRDVDGDGKIGNQLDPSRYR